MRKTRTTAPDASGQIGLHSLMTLYTAPGVNFRCWVNTSQRRSTCMHTATICYAESISIALPGNHYRNVHMWNSCEEKWSGSRMAINLLAFGYALWESFVVVGVCIGLLVLFRQRWNHQGRLARSLAATVYIVYLIHAPVLVSFAYTFRVVALYPLLKWGIAVLITIPLCFLISLLIRKIPFVNRVL